MGVSASPNLWRAALLGAINGLLAGWCARVALCLELEYARQEWARQATCGESINFSEPLPLSVLLVWGGLAFAAASVLVHRILAKRDTSALLLWQFVGVIAVLYGALGFALLISVEDVVRGQPFGESLSRLPPGVGAEALVGALGIVVPLNLVYGGSIHLIVKRLKTRKPALP